MKKANSPQKIGQQRIFAKSPKMSASNQEYPGTPNFALHNIPNLQQPDPQVQASSAASTPNKTVQGSKTASPPPSGSNSKRKNQKQVNTSDTTSSLTSRSRKREDKEC